MVIRNQELTLFTDLVFNVAEDLTCAGAVPELRISGEFNADNTALRKAISCIDRIAQTIENFKLVIADLEKKKGSIVENAEAIKYNQDIDLSVRNIDVSIANETNISEGHIKMIESCKTEIISIDKEVEKRKEHLESGSSGPWLFLYWNGDRSKYQEFSFPSWGARKSFEEYCVRLKDAQ